MRHIAKYRNQVIKQGKNALASTALGIMFASFAKVIPDPYGHGFIFGCGVILGKLNIVPTLFEKLDSDQKNNLKVGLHYIKKAVAAAEAAAIGGVFVEQIGELTGEEDLVQQTLAILIPAFATILGLNGILGIITKLEQMLDKDSAEEKISLPQILDLLIGSGGAIGQSGIIFTVMGGGLDKANGNKINALIGFGQALTSGMLSLWNIRKIMTALPVNLDLNEPLTNYETNYEIDSSSSETVQV